MSHKTGKYFGSDKAKVLKSLPEENPKFFKAVKQLKRHSADRVVGRSAVARIKI